jgi:hypothetical protein
MFGKKLKNEDLNPANNPLCHKGFLYERKGEGKPYTTNTKQPSILEFIQGNGKLEPTNIVTFTRESIGHEQVKICHGRLCEINGIGPKIASLFLRDVATFYEVFPSKGRDLLQPVDVWIRRVSEHLLQDELLREDRAGWIVRQAIQSGVNPEAVNGGMWYFGSQIAGSKYRMEKALDDLAYAKVLLEEHMEAIRQETLAWERKREVDDG